MINGKQIRLKKLLPNGRAAFLALDHGFSMGPIKGLEDLDSVLSKLRDSDINGLIINYGALKNLNIESLGNCRIPIIVHLSGSGLGENAKEKFAIYSVIDALKMGADAVSLQINFNTKNESEQIVDAAKIIGQADDMGMPVLLMMYNKGTDENGRKLVDIVRLGIELGADIIKVDIGGDLSLLQRISKNSRIPILVAGGGLKDSETLKQSLNDYLKHGAAGVSIGRNIFQSEDPKSLMSTVCKFINDYEK